MIFRVKALYLNKRVRINSIKVFDKYHQLTLDHPEIIDQIEFQIETGVAKARYGMIQTNVVLSKRNVNQILIQEMRACKEITDTKIKTMFEGESVQVKAKLKKAMAEKEAQMIKMNRLALLKSVNYLVNHN